MARAASFHLSSSPTFGLSSSAARVAAVPSSARFPARSRVQFPLMPLRLRRSSLHALSSNDIKVGLKLVVDGAPWRVLEFLHVKPGKGAAFVRTKLRNLITGNVAEKTFRAGSSIDKADVVKETKQFTYKDGSQYAFMDKISYEEIFLNEDDLGDKKKWLKEGMECTLLFWNGKVIDFDVPITVELTVIHTEPGRDDTVQGGGKPATLDTGAVVNVPLYTKIGDKVLVDTRIGEYAGRGG